MVGDDTEKVSGTARAAVAEQFQRHGARGGLQHPKISFTQSFTAGAQNAGLLGNGVRQNRLDNGSRDMVGP
jgi:hypothetical protein